MSNLQSPFLSLLLGFYLTIFLAFISCHFTATGSIVTVAGSVECLDCTARGFKTELTYHGLKVAIKCKSNDLTEYKTQITGTINKDGSFAVKLPGHLLQQDGDLAADGCIAQLHDAKNKTCSSEAEAESSKIVATSENGIAGIRTFSIANAGGKLQFSSAVCLSAFFWPHFNITPVPKWDPLHKFFPFPPLPPKPFFPKKSLPPPIPIYKPPIYKLPIIKPPIIKPPIVKPPIIKPPIVKPPIIKPPFIKPPIVKPPVLKPPIVKAPIIKPPIFKPPILKPPIIKSPMVKPPIIKAPVYKKPLPPLPQFPPIYKKPLPPLPKFPPIFKKPMPPCPPLLPKIPPHHGWPPLPPIFHKPTYPIFPPDKVHSDP